MQQLKQSLNLTSQMSQQMPPRPVNSSNLPHSSPPVPTQSQTPQIVQPTIQIPPSVQRMMEENEKQKRAVLQKQAQMIDTQKKLPRRKPKVSYATFIGVG